MCRLREDSHGLYRNGEYAMLWIYLTEGTHMGERGEVFATKLMRNDRTYFFNVKENIYGDLFLNIVESRPTDTEGRYLRQSVIVYQEDLGEFIKEFQKSLDFIKQHGSRRPAAPRVVRRTERKEEEN